MHTSFKLLTSLFLVAGVLFGSIPAAHAQESDAERVVTVDMVDRGGGQWRFEPETVEVRPGDLLRFVQKDVAPHNVEFTDVPKDSDITELMMGPFLFKPGETYELTIDGRFAEGTYDFVCTPHAALGMVGTLEVLPSRDTLSTN